MKKINSNDFSSLVEKSKKPILVDFFANWCSPCKALYPKLEEINHSIKDIDIVKVDVDESPDIASKFLIKSVPTLLLFKEGQVIDSLTGNQSKEVIIDLFKKHKLI